MDRLSAMQSFLRVVELGGFRAAAEDRSLSKAFVSKQVKALEAALGVVLLTRTTRRLSLTEAGRIYVDHCRRILADIASAEADVGAHQSTPRGLLRINAPMSLGLLVIAPILPAFMARHADIRVDLELDDRAVDLVAEGFDVTLRVRRALADSSLFARRLAPIDHVLCASPSLLQGRDVPREADDLLALPRLVYALSEAGNEWHLPGPCGTDTVISGPPVLTANSSIAIREALLAGVGVALIPAFVVSRDLAAGRLVHLLPDLPLRRYDLSAIFAPVSPPPKLRVFIDFLLDTLPKNLSGEPKSFDGD